MLYIKVKPELDNRIRDNKGNIFIANELYTIREWDNIKKLYPGNLKKLNNMLELVDISRKNTYWFFGARFEKKEEV